MKKIISISLLTMFLAGIGFVTTSKREYDPNAPVQTDYCLEPGFDAKIKINLDPFNIRESLKTTNSTTNHFW
ncbi:hypothetical protein [Flavobacterium sp.]|uniref:hypothetical protein n=1 Tax=Flavobacterium sp. TaxID=239 RepID=UPI003751B642